MSLIQDLQWRYATKRMTGQKVPQEKIEAILDAAILAPSSYGLQPFNIIVVEDPELKKELQKVGYNQPQIVECSHLLVFAAWENVTAEKLDDYINLISTTRNIPVESLAGFKTMGQGFVTASPDDNFTWAARQAYIALGIAVAEASEQKVDNCGMEGFDKAGVDEVLGLKELGLKSLAFLALGYRDEANDPTFGQPKVRRPKAAHVIYK